MWTVRRAALLHGCAAPPHAAAGAEDLLGTVRLRYTGGGQQPSALIEQERSSLASSVRPCVRRSAPRRACLRADPLGLRFPAVLPRPPPHWQGLRDGNVLLLEDGPPLGPNQLAVRAVRVKLSATGQVNQRGRPELEQVR